MIVRPILGTLIGCVGSQSCTELIENANQGSLNLITFATYIFVSMEGLIFQSKFFTVQQHIPTRSYLKLVVLSFTVAICNNYAMKFDLHFPLFIIFKSASLLTHLVLRYFILGSIYRIDQIASILVVTAGVVIFTLASYESHENVVNSIAPWWTEYLPVPPFVIGILLLTFGVLLATYLGICQEQLHRLHGNHYREAMFFVHFLSLPAFTLLGDGLTNAATVASQSPPFKLGSFEIPVPSTWAYIGAVCILQYICVNNIYRLTSVTSSLTVNMVISLRKFISLFLSFVVFGNPFNFFHVFGAFFVFIGTLMYAKVF